MQQATQAKIDLADQQRLETDKILVATYVDEADSVNAAVKLAAIPQNTAENIEFVNLYQQILNGIHPPAGPGKAMSAQETLIRTLTNNANSPHTALAQSIVAAYYAEPFDKTPLLPPVLKNANTQPAVMGLMPNPANNQVEVFINLPHKIGNATLYVLNMQGSVIDQLQVTQAQLTLHTTNYSNGLYMLHLKTETGAVYTQKLAIIK